LQKPPDFVCNDDAADRRCNDDINFLFGKMLLRDAAQRLGVLRILQNFGALKVLWTVQSRSELKVAFQ
jgi:hypothetical protein